MKKKNVLFDCLSVYTKNKIKTIFDLIVCQIYDRAKKNPLFVCPKCLSNLLYIKEIKNSLIFFGLRLQQYALKNTKFATFLIVKLQQYIKEVKNLLFIRFCFEFTVVY